MPRLIRMARVETVPVARPRTEAKAERDRFYAGTRWVKLRHRYLSIHPLCERCQAEGRIVPAVDVHHKVERLERPELAYSWSNLEALCKPCHTSHHKGKRPWM